MSAASENKKADEHAVADALGKLVEALKAASQPAAPTASAPAPVTAEEFREVLQRIHDAGLRFDEMGQVSALGTTSAERESAERTIRDLAARFPFVPREVRHLIEASFTSRAPDPLIVGDEAEGKLAALEKIVITPELREQYFLRRAFQVPVLEDIDWQVGIKTAERGWSSAAGIPYTELTLTLTHYPENESTVVSACIGEDMLASLINELSQALDALKQAKRMASHLSSSSRLEDDE